MNRRIYFFFFLAVVILAAVGVIIFNERPTEDTRTPVANVSLEDALASISSRSKMERTEEPSAIPNVIDYPDVQIEVNATSDEIDVSDNSIVVVSYSPHGYASASKTRATKIILRFNKGLTSDYSLEDFQSKYTNGDLYLSFPEGTSRHDAENIQFISYEDGILKGVMSGQIDAVHVGGCTMIQDGSCYDFFYTGDSTYRVEFSLPIP